MALNKHVDKDPKASNGNPDTELSFLSELTKLNDKGSVCVKVSTVSQSLKARSGWQYRKMTVVDCSLEAEVLVAESKYSEWKFRAGDHVVCIVRSNGIDNGGRLSLFFDDFVGPFDTAKLLYDELMLRYEGRPGSTGRMKSSETVYQISAREAKSLLQLIKLWIGEQKPQHYTKWCQMHQIVATNLFYMGLVRRTASMSGYYYPTKQALEFFSGRIKFPKKKVFVKGSGGKHVLVGEDGIKRSFDEYLNDHADRDSALQEYRETLERYQDRIKATLEKTEPE